VSSHILVDVFTARGCGCASGSHAVLRVAADGALLNLWAKPWNSQRILLVILIVLDLCCIHNRFITLLSPRHRDNSACVGTDVYERIAEKGTDLDSWVDGLAAWIRWYRQASAVHVARRQYDLCTLVCTWLVVRQCALVCSWRPALDGLHVPCCCVGDRRAGAAWHVAMPLPGWLGQRLSARQGRSGSMSSATVPSAVVAAAVPPAAPSAPAPAVPSVPALAAIPAPSDAGPSPVSTPRRLHQV